MTAIDRFMEDVKHRIAPGLPGAARFEADLTRHLRERVEAGEDEASAVERMGSPGARTERSTSSRLSRTYSSPVTATSALTGSSGSALNNS